jgi:hypothetical protein
MRTHIASVLADTDFSSSGPAIDAAASMAFPRRWLVYRDRAPLGSSTMQHLRTFLGSSRTARSLCAVIAVMAVWNLGCVGFQPLFAGMMGPAARAGMDCDAEGMLVAPATPTRTDQSVSTGGVDRAGSVISAASTDHAAVGHSVSCGCQSCHAPPSGLQAAAVDGASFPLARALNPVTPPCANRAPLVPPPQAVL